MHECECVNERCPPETRLRPVAHGGSLRGLGFRGSPSAGRAGLEAQEPVRAPRPAPPPRGGTRHSGLPEPADASRLEWKAPRPEVEGTTQEDEQGGTSAPRLH